MPNLFSKQRNVLPERSRIRKLVSFLNAPDNTEVLSLLGFTQFFLGNYEEAKEVNETILTQKPDDWYANKGLGLSLHKMGKSKEGIGFLEKSIQTAPAGLADPYHDLAAVYYEIGDTNSANAVLARLRV
jgi:Flp pilus assembly protein TadD